MIKFIELVLLDEPIPEGLILDTWSKNIFELFLSPDAIASVGENQNGNFRWWSNGVFISDFINYDVSKVTMKYGKEHYVLASPDEVIEAMFNRSGVALIPCIPKGYPGTK